jgi:ribosome assembly protein RRB1
MPKRTSDAADFEGGVSKSAARGQETARAADNGDTEMGEFEDRWEDDIESDGEVVEAGEGGDDDEDGEGRSMRLEW